MVIGFQPDTEGFNYTSFFAMDNMLILDSELQEVQNEVQKGKTFSIGLTGLYNMSSTFNKGEIAIIVKDQEGNETEISKIEIDEPLSYSDSFVEITPWLKAINFAPLLYYRNAILFI